jgi:hypothetical protein
MASDFKVIMSNKWYLTPYETFNQPSGSQLMENLRVTLSGNLLSIEGLKENSLEAAAVIAARKSIEIESKGITAFVIVEDNLFSTDKTYPAIGTAIVFQENGKWRLRAAGYDRNGKPKGWIFDATETGPG